MTIEELDAKLKPGEPHAASYEGDSWYPSGGADGIIFRSPKKKLVTKNGQLVEYGAVLEGKVWRNPADVQGQKIQSRSFCYLKSATEEERTESFGFTHKYGIVSHPALVDVLANHNKALRDLMDGGFKLNCWMSMTSIGRNAMNPNVLAHLKVIGVEEGIFALLYDPEGSIP